METKVELREGDEFAMMLYQARLDRPKANGKPLAMAVAAAECGTTEHTYGTWEKGTAKPALRSGDGLLQRLATFTGYSEQDVAIALGVMSDPETDNGVILRSQNTLAAA